MLAVGPTVLTRAEWDDIARRLRAPFDPKEVDFRVQGRASENTGKAQVVAYIDARAVQDRLDAVVGAGNWSFDWESLVIANGEVQVAKGTLTIYGVAKSDAGSASNFEQSLGAVSHCFKRAAVHWGIGRYLYNLPPAWVSVERGGRIPQATLNELRAHLPRPDGSAAVAAARPADAHADARRAKPVERTDEPRQRAPQAPTVPRPTAAASGHAARATSTAPASAGTSSNTPGEALGSATEQQRAAIRKLCATLGRAVPDDLDGMGGDAAKALIVDLSGAYQAARRADQHAAAAAHSA